MSFQVMLEQLGGGMLTSILIFILTLLGSLPLALPVAFGRMSKCRPLCALMRVYISFMRGTPLMLQLLVVYFGPWFLLRIPLTNGYRFYAVIIAFVLNYAAYFAEIYRAGIESIPLGQYEAAEVLGYSKGQTFRRIIEIGVLAKAGSIHPGEDNGLTDNLGILLTTGLVDQLLRVFLV